MQTVAGLSTLTRLHLRSYGDAADMTPGCSELACLRSTTLRDLSVSFTQVPVSEAHIYTILRYVENCIPGQDQQ